MNLQKIDIQNPFSTQNPDYCDIFSKCQWNWNSSPVIYGCWSFFLFLSQLRELEISDFEQIQSGVTTIKQNLKKKDKSPSGSKNLEFLFATEHHLKYSIYNVQFSAWRNFLSSEH